MSKKVVVVGAVALGPKVACRLKRLAPGFDVTLIDKDQYISYAGCGIPYYVGGDVTELEGLYSTSAHVPRDTKYFENVKGLNVKTRTRVMSINRKEKTVSVKNLTDGAEEEIPYDKLVLATGAKPIVPPIPGTDLPGVFVVASLNDAKAIKDKISRGRVERAVVIGGGAIGLEMAEALTDLWGIETTLVEMMDQLAPTAFGKDMALIIKNEMEEKGVSVLLNERVTELVGDASKGVKGLKTDQREIPCDLVIPAVGVKPHSYLAKKAGLATGRFGGILVDSRMRTSDPDIFAGGDCVEISHLVSGEYIPMPLGSLANRQGRIIGTNLAGGFEEFKGTVGTFCVKIFDMTAARAGLTVKQAVQAGFDAVHAVVVQADRAHFYPTMELMYMKLIADRRTRRVLGIEAVGPQGDAVKARVDAVAVMLQYQPTVSDVCNLEVAYAPPFASAMDIVNNAANSLDNIIGGRHRPIDVTDFLGRFKSGTVRVLDVRSPVQAGPFVEKYKENWVNINQEDLYAQLDKVPKDQPLYLVCGSGPRSYESQLMLRHNGVNTNTLNIQGGIGMILKSDPDFAPEGYK